MLRGGFNLTISKVLMKQILLLILLYPVFSTISAQSKKISFLLGTQYELPRKADDFSFFGNETDGIINLSLKKHELNLLRFNPKTLEKTAESTIEIPEATRNMNNDGIIDFGTSYYWLHSDWDKKEKKEYLFYDELDIVSGKISKSSIKIHETTKIAGYTSGGLYSYKTESKYRVNFNADRTLMLVSYRLFPEIRDDKKNFDKIGVLVFDTKMNKLWGDEYTLPYTEALMENLDFAIDGNGNAYLLAKVYDNEKRNQANKETGKPGYHYEVMKFSKDSRQVIQHRIDIGDYFPGSSSLAESANHALLIVCTYSKKAYSSGTDGVFLATMDASGNISKYKNGYYEFPLEEMKKFETVRTQNKMDKAGDYEAPNLLVRDILAEPDGGVFLSLEEHYIESTTMNNPRNTYTYNTYYYNDIFCTRINADGSFAWLRKVPKQQYGNYDQGTMGFKLVSDNTGYYLLYLDNKKNMELTENEAPTAYLDGWGGQVVVSKVGKNGNISKDLVFDAREEEIKIFPAQFRRINGNQFIGRALLKRGDYKPLLITVNQ